jgi:hypothetical protein
VETEGGRPAISASDTRAAEGREDDPADGPSILDDQSSWIVKGRRSLFDGQHRRDRGNRLTLAQVHDPDAGSVPSLRRHIAHRCTDERAR